MSRDQPPGSYACRLCSASLLDKRALVEHLKSDHEPLETISYAAITMIDEQTRDESALEFHRRFAKLRQVIGE